VRVVVVFAATLACAFLIGLRADAAGYKAVPEPVKRRVRAEVRRQFPPHTWQRVYCIINRESGWNPRAVSRTNDHGLLQLNAIHRSRFPGLWPRRYEIQANIRMGYLLWRDVGFQPWQGGGYSC